MGVTGSVAAYKTADLSRLLNESLVGTGATLTESAVRFVTPLLFSALGCDPVHTEGEDNHHEPYSHLAPSQSAHAFAVVPATASILAKTAHGFADDLLSTQILACPGPVHFCPAMNPAMWSNPATKANIDILQSRGHVIIEPHTGKVACGDSGKGRMAPLAQIYYHILRTLAPQDMRSQSVLVTAGPTHEYFDLVRFFSNPSSGRMGLAIAMACWLRGAKVYFVHGPMHSLFSLPDFELIPVTSASQMLEACHAVWARCHKGIFSAAVSDFSPIPCTAPKFKKSGLKEIRMDMTANPDILATMSARKGEHQTIVGFAAEAVDLEKNAREKMLRKKLDIIVANLVSAHKTPFGSLHNQVTVMDRWGRMEKWPHLSKPEVAWRITDWFTLI